MKLSEFQTEYYDEINSAKVDELKLKTLGIKSATLAKEVYLREIYGDKIVGEKIEEVNEIVESNVPAKKSITRLNLDEINFKSELDIIYENIEKSKFDEGLEYFIKKLEG